MVAALVVAGSISSGGFYTPGMALVADRSERAGLPQGIGFGVTNTAWAAGALIGPAVGGALAQAFGDAVPYLLCGALCGLTLLAATARRGAPATGLSRRESLERPRRVERLQAVVAPVDERVVARGADPSAAATPPGTTGCAAR